MMKKTSKSQSPTRLGQILKTVREKQNRTQRAFAAEANFQQAQIARAERGADIRTSTLIELARSLGLEVMLIPQELVPAVEAMMQDGHPASEDRPLYALDQEPP